LLLVFDTGFLSISRIAILDIFLLFFIMLAFLLAIILIQQKSIGCQLAHVNVPGNFGNDVPHDFTHNAPPDFGQNVPL
jgi:4-amino-4-deoxy-L-arabinose transferase-like glycosyltransferase